MFLTTNQSMSRCIIKYPLKISNPWKLPAVSSCTAPLDEQRFVLSLPLSLAPDLWSQRCTPVAARHKQAGTSHLQREFWFSCHKRREMVCQPLLPGWGEAGFLAEILKALWYCTLARCTLVALVWHLSWHLIGTGFSFISPQDVQKQTPGFHGESILLSPCMPEVPTKEEPKQWDAFVWYCFYKGKMWL